MAICDEADESNSSELSQRGSDVHPIGAHAERSAAFWPIAKLVPYARMVTGMNEANGTGVIQKVLDDGRWSGRSL
jgi:hypothetical protein